MVFEFELKDKKIMKNCDNCRYGLVKKYKTLVDKEKVIVIGVCDSCDSIYESSDSLYSYKEIEFVGA